MKIHSAKWIATAAAGFALCGCIHTSETVYRNPERVKVEFENDAAARMFYETLSKMKPDSTRRETDTTIRIPVIFRSERHEVEGENVAFNDAVKDCDTNQDGKITETEARIFQEHYAK